MWKVLKNMRFSWTKMNRMQKRGSVLILCVVTLVIIALMGLAFLQQMKIDAFSMVEHERNYIDQVMNGIVNEFRSTAALDVEDNRAVIGGTANTGRLLYDYPWTDYSIAPGWDVIRGDGTTVQAYGTERDVRYLASTEPYFDGTNYYWMHLSNLGGIRLDLPVLGSSAIEPFESIMDDFAFEEKRDTYVSLNHLNGARSANYRTRGADADGDGLVDSFWTWAPEGVREIGGRKYVMAIRIVDLNSLLNVNVATSNTLKGSYGVARQTGDEAARGYTPVDLDLTRFLERAADAMSITPAQATPEIDNIFAHRLFDSIPDPPGSTAWPYSGEDTGVFNYNSVSERRNIWDNQASYYANHADRRYQRRDEMELRYLSGINNPDFEATIEDAFNLPRFMRNFGGPASESAWNNVAGVGDLNDWFYGGSPWSDVDGRSFPAIRHMLTGLSGIGQYGPNYGGAATAGGRFMLDLYRDWDETRLIAERIIEAFKHPNADTAHAGYVDGEWYLNKTAAEEADLEAMAWEFALAIEGYSDSDNIPNDWTLNGTQYLSLERMPFLREVYAQGLYIDTESAAGSGNFDTWAAHTDSQAIAIEIGNPFAHDMPGTELDADFQIRITQGGVTIDEWIFTGMPDIQARHNTDKDDSLIIVSNPLDQTTNHPSTLDRDLHNLQSTVSTTDIDGIPTLTLADGEITFNFGLPIVIELQVDIDTDPSPTAVDWKTYDSITIDSLDAAYASPNLAQEPHRVVQRSIRRDSELIRYIAHYGPGLGSDANIPGGTTDTANVEIGIDALGSDTKAGASTPNTPPTLPDVFYIPDNFQLPIANQPIKSIAELAWIHMFGFTDTIPFSQRIVAIDPNERFLLLNDLTDPDWPTYSDPNHRGVPHALMLMDYFTTIGTRNDNIDNDNDGTIDNDEEIFIPGTININTAPLHLLTLSSPLPENIDDIEKLMRTIQIYRDAPVWREQIGVSADFDLNTDALSDFPFPHSDIRHEMATAGYINALRRDTPGIGSIGELLLLNPLAAVSATEAYNMDRYGQNGTNDGAQEYSLYPHKEEVAAGTAVQTDTLDGPEEMVGRFQYLPQAYTVRTDRFVIFGVVRGYNDKQFNSSAVEEAQFVAVIDRGNMVNSGDVGQILAFKRLR